MSWARLDDHFPTHPKVVAAGGDAAWLHVCALCYCAEHLTNGRVPKGLVPRLSDRRRPTELAARLVEVGMWFDEGDTYRLHDYLTYNPSREQVEKERAAARERRARGGRASRERNPNDGGSSEDGSANEANPDPTRPDVPTEHRARAKRATAPPNVFTPDDALRAWAAEKHPDLDPDDQTRQWLDWCAANGRTYKDHRAGWRTWLNRASGFDRGNGQRGPVADPTDDSPQRTCPTCGDVNFLPGTGSIPCACEREPA